MLWTGAGICSVGAHREICPRKRIKVFCNWVVALSVYLLMTETLSLIRCLRQMWNKSWTISLILPGFLRGAAVYLTQESSKWLTPGGCIMPAKSKWCCLLLSFVGKQVVTVIEIVNCLSNQDKHLFCYIISC